MAALTARRQGLERIVTIPNALSLSRIALVGLYLWLLFGPNERVVATCVLAVAGATDFADGYLARRLDQVTNLGIALDPTADRILLAAAIVSMIDYGAIPIWLAVIILARELTVASSVLLLAARGGPRLEVSRIGKAAAFGLMICFPLLLLGHGPGGWTHPLTIATLIAAVPALVLSYVSGLGYIIPAQRLIRESGRIDTPNATDHRL